MYRLLIVDDEAGHRKGMVGLLCLLKPDYLVFEAENGKRALQMMEVMAFDLVLTDIRMPGMDGLTFLSQARSRQPQVRFAILSAYGTFEYAKQGISLGADDYLLKPVDVEELRACLDRMEERLHEERVMEREQAEMQQSLISMQSNYIEQQMYRFVAGELPEKEAEGIRQIFGREASGAVLYFQAEGGWRKEQARSDARFFLREELKACGSVVLFPPVTDGDALAGILACGRDRLGALAEAVLRAVEAVEEKTGERLIAGMCCLADAFFERLSDLYQCARGACLRHFFEPGKRLLCAEADRPFDPYQAVHLDVPLGSIAERIRQGDAQGAYRLFEASLNRLARNESLYPNKVKEVVVYALMFIIGEDDVRLRTEDKDRVIQRIDAEILECRSFPELLGGLRASLEALCGVLSEDARCGVPDEALRYVQAHFCEDVTLAGVARHFHYNPSYFSIQFKQSAGVPFSDYVCELRMQRAAELLKTTNLYAAKIGAQVGYPNAAYFTKAFKRRFGLSPDQYRKRGGDV